MNIIFCNKKAKSTAHNRSVTVRRLSAARLRKIPVGAAPLCGFCSATFFCARKNAARFSSSGAKKNVTYRRNVIRTKCSLNTQNLYIIRNVLFQKKCIILLCFFYLIIEECAFGAVGRILYLIITILLVYCLAELY